MRLSGLLIGALCLLAGTVDSRAVTVTRTFTVVNTTGAAVPGVTLTVVFAPASGSCTPIPAAVTVLGVTNAAGQLTHVFRCPGGVFPTDRCTWFVQFSKAGYRTSISPYTQVCCLAGAPIEETEEVDVALEDECCNPCELGELLGQLLPDAPSVTSADPCFTFPVPDPPTIDCCETLVSLLPRLPDSPRLPSTHPCLAPPCVPVPPGDCICPAVFDPVDCDQGTFTNQCEADCECATNCEPA